MLGASKAIRAIVAVPSIVSALCLAGALAAFLVYPAYAQRGDEGAAPANLTAAIADGGGSLNWSSPVQDSDSVTGYESLRQRSKVGEGTLLGLVADTGPTGTTYVDATANEPEIPYGYRSRRFVAARGIPGPTTPSSTCLRKPTSRNRRRRPRRGASLAKYRLPKRRRVQEVALTPRRRRWMLETFPSW